MTIGTRTPRGNGHGRRNSYLHGEGDGDDEYPIQTPQKKRKPLNRLHTEVLLRMVLQDAQTRLVFRAQAMLVSEVEYYVPKDGDLEYPEKLGNGQSFDASTGGKWECADIEL